MIEARQLSKRYGTMQAVDGVSFSVAPGEVVGLLGPNGAGKTTLLRMLAGLLRPTAGAAFVAGHDVQAETLAAKSHLGFLSADTALYQRLTPRELLRYFGRLHQQPDALVATRIAQLAETLQMQPFLDRRCGQLSAGQRQKTNIARALLHEPPALILDEPTTALDIVTAGLLLQAIAAARDAGRAVLFSTHIFSEAEALCDRVLFVNAGRIVDHGTVGELRARSRRGTLADALFCRLAVAAAGARS
jgi:sodium transport system ATP-binding protein